MVGSPMDILVIDTPDSYGMLLSRKWTNSIGGYLKMDLSHMIILDFDGENVYVYNEPHVKGHVERRELFEIPSQEYCHPLESSLMAW